MFPAAPRLRSAAVYSAAPWLRGCCDGCGQHTVTYISGFRAELGRLCPQNDQREAYNIPVIHHVGCWGPDWARRGKNGQCVYVEAASWRLREQLIMSTPTYASPIFPVVQLWAYLLHAFGSIQSTLGKLIKTSVIGATISSGIVVYSLNHILTYPTCKHFHKIGPKVALKGDPSYECKTCVYGYVAWSLKEA